VALVTGQERAEKASQGLDYTALAAFPGTLVFYMGVTTAPRWTTALILAGKSASTPAAIVRRCSWPDQQTIGCTLGTVADEIEARHLRPPALVVVGEACTLTRPHCWFVERPLFGSRVLVTRASSQALPLATKLTELGADVVVQPAIEIGPPDDLTAVDSMLAKLGQFDWLVFSSSNGVQSLLNRLLLSRDLRALAHLKLAAIGPGTADALARYHLHADLIPEEFRAESLAKALHGEARAGRRFLLARASRGREVLAEELTAHGGKVEQVVVYASHDIAQPEAEIVEQLADGRIDWVTVTSSAIARSVVRLYGQELRKSRLASISPVTSAALRELGFEPTVEAQQYTIEGLVEAVLQAYPPRSTG
jgi:uroporphyrinogen III methyltransferase/synthase